MVVVVVVGVLMVVKELIAAGVVMVMVAMIPKTIPNSVSLRVLLVVRRKEQL
jgi:hypothetical protein